MATLILWLIGLTVVGAFISVIAKEFDNSKGKGNAKNTLNEQLQEEGIEDYNYEQFEDGHIIMHDRTYGRIWVVDSGGGYVATPYSDIADVELIIDDSTEYKSSLSSAAGRAIVGGVVAGGVGAIIGGVTGKKNGKKIVNKIELLISYHDYDFPYSRITLLESQHGEKISDYTYENAYSQGLQWSRRLTSMMR